MNVKVWFFSLMGFLLFFPSTYASHDMVEANLAYGQLTSESHILKIDRPTMLRLTLENPSDSAGDLLYKVCQIKEFFDDENDNKLVRYDETVIRGIIPFSVDESGSSLGNHKVQQFQVQPGEYFIELSTLLEAFPVFDTPTGKGHATLTME